MKLEKEISQTAFRSEYHKAAINIVFTYNWLAYNQNKLFDQFDITPQQYNVLRILRGQHPSRCNLKLIKERMLDRMSDVSRIIDKLYKKGYVSRTECPSDRRNVDLLISEKGMELLSKLDFIDEEMKKLLGNLSEKEVKTLNELLDKARG